MRKKICNKKTRKKDPTTKKIIKGQRWRTLASERCEQEAVCADGCLFHRGGQKQETNWSCWQQLGVPPSQSSPFHYHPACCSSMMMLPQVVEEQQQQEQPVWPFPTTCSKLSQGRIPYPPLFLLLLSFFFSILFGNSEEIFFLQLELCCTTPPTFSSANLSEEIWQNPTSNMQFPHNTHARALSLSLSLCNQKFCNKKCTSLKQKQINLSLQQQPQKKKKKKKKNKKKKKTKNGFWGFISSWSSRSLCDFQTHQALDDDQRPKAKQSVVVSGKGFWRNCSCLGGLALGFEDLPILCSLMTSRCREFSTPANG